MQKKRSLGPIGIGFFLLIPVLCAGCQEKTIARASDRNSNFKVTFHENAATTEGTAQAAPSVRDIASLGSDRFGASVVLNVEQVSGHKDLQEIPWQDVESLLGSWVSPEQANIKQLNNAAFLISLDAGNLMSMMGNSSTSPGVTVLEFRKPLAEDSVTKKQGRTFSRILDERFLLIGKKSNIESVSFRDSEASSFLRQEIQRGRMVAGWLSFDQLRPQLDAMFQMLKGVPGMDMGKLTAFPQAADHLEFWLTLDGDSALEVQLFANDEEVVAELAKRATEALEQAKQAAFPGGGSGFVPMVASKAEQPGIAILEEIRDENLLRIKAETNKLRLQLATPKALSDFTKASVDDVIRQMGLSARANRFSQIATALKKRARNDNDLKELTKLATEAPAAGAPFNWRVALLPELGEKKLFDAFDFSKPWNDPKNLEAAKLANPFVDALGSLETSIVWVQTPDGDNPAPRIADAGQNSLEPWIKPCQPVAFDMQNCGREDESGFLVITQNHKTRAVSKENFDDDVFCPGVQQPQSGMNFGF